MTNYTQTMSASQAYAQPTMYAQPGTNGGHQQQQPHLLYFITRTNGTIVPLVPVDELPYSVRLEGVPRNTSPEQTFGLQFLGSHAYTGMLFKTKDETPSMQCASSQPSTTAHHRRYSNGKQYMAPDALARQTITNTIHHPHSLSSPFPTHHTSPSPPTTSSSTSSPPPTDPQAIIDAIVSSKSGAGTAARLGYTARSSVTPPSGKVPDANKKTHCSYWIRTGECDYAQQGCMYKHEMPDEKGLAALGFRGTPRWWLERKQAIRLGGGGGFDSGRGEETRETVGSKLKPSEWLRKQSLASTASGRSEEGSETEVESVKSKGSGKAVKEVAPAVLAAVAAKAASSPKQPWAEKKITFVKKPVEQSASSASTTSSETDSPTNVGDLIDFEIIPGPPSLSSTTKARPMTPPTSTESSPRTTQKQPTTKISASDAKGKEVFVPKGESKTQHFADHASRQQRSCPTLRSSTKPVSEAQVASLEKQIQAAQKSKCASGGAGTGGQGGLMASKHARAGQTEAKKGKRGNGRMATGLRVRRPAPLKYLEIPTGEILKDEAQKAK